MWRGFRNRPSDSGMNLSTGSETQATSPPFVILPVSRMGVILAY